MTCIVCNEDKLSKEFAPYNASKECDHACLTCLRCLVNGVTKNGKCAYPGCLQEIDINCKPMVFFRDLLANLFSEYETVYSPVVQIPGTKTYVNITGLTGNSTRVAYSPKMSVYDLQVSVYKAFGIETSKQKLLYKDTELQKYTPEKRLATFQDFEVEPNATILFHNFKHVVFDLYWGYPGKGIDYLDASCLMFCGTTFYRICDYYDWDPHPSIEHSGDMMNDNKRKGHHKIDVFLNKIPPKVTHLFFTLSAWKSPNISKYKKPSVKFYEASRPMESLCKTTFTHANNSQAVVMCSMSRKADTWEIFESGQLSAGNARKYAPLKETIRRLVSTGI
ncbi:Hypothetical predicted protein [Mytilus galloprovincialis]|uniref:Ubiquitin-like domain-containing protein n=1 Tax=Mytilus galloprovincialis TaxID=29158 RepID=A0A8B6DL64_MYTGA|nr:Hypothetical predicted protein [Mytilus galloprovincialis]